MELRKELTEFSLLGGPLHRLGGRLGLVRGGTDTVPLGVALGAGAWGVMMALAAIEGVAQKLLSLSLVAGHVRLLVVIPLFFVCESAVDPRMTAFVRLIVQMGVVPAKAVPALELDIARVVRWKDSWLPDTLCLLAAGLLFLVAQHLQLTGATARLDPDRAIIDLPLAGQWYWTVCLTLIRFLMLRWLWRLGLWCYFLWRVARLPLYLVPTHPDYTGGLGGLELVQTHFSPLVVAISALQSASLAEEISAGKAAFEAIYPMLGFVLAVDALLVIGPLFIFASTLWSARIKGTAAYMEFASHYVGSFDRKWVGPDAHPREKLLGTPDLQSLADLANGIAVVRLMRWVPLSRRLIRNMVLAALLPFLPLLLLRYPIPELVEKFISRMTGL